MKRTPGVFVAMVRNGPRNSAERIRFGIERVETQVAQAAAHTAEAFNSTGARLLILGRLAELRKIERINGMFHSGYTPSGKLRRVMLPQRISSESCRSRTWKILAKNLADKLSIRPKCD